MSNIKSVIDSHNKNKMREKPAHDERECNCRKKESCPLQNQCLSKGIVHKATVTPDQGETETYVGLTDTAFKTRLANHKQSFEEESLKNQTELSKYIWNLKSRGRKFIITWRILGRARSYSNTTKRCGLCLLEKFFIIRYAHSELGVGCRHATKFC